MDELEERLATLRQQRRVIIDHPGSWCGGIMETGFMKPAASSALRALDLRVREVLIEILSMRDD